MSTGESFAALFPGQGSQRVGMGSELLARWGPITEPIFETAGEIVGYDLRRLCLEGPPERLRRTDVTQPAIFTVSVATLEVLRRHDVVPAAAAGHSLGELAALVCAGCLAWEDGLRLVAERGRLMAAVADVTPGTMAAVMGIPAGDVAALCAAVAGRSGEVIEVANLNSDSQTVVAGSAAGVALLVAAADAAGARTVGLEVGAPFHSSLMAPMEAEFAAVLATCPIEAPTLPLVANATGRFVAGATEVRAALRQQLAAAVRWSDTMATLAAAGHTTFVEVGPGRVLSGLARVARPDARVLSTHDGRRVEALVTGGLAAARA